MFKTIIHLRYLQSNLMSSNADVLIKKSIDNLENNLHELDLNMINQVKSYVLSFQIFRVLLNNISGINEKNNFNEETCSNRLRTFIKSKRHSFKNRITLFSNEKIFNMMCTISLKIKKTTIMKQVIYCICCTTLCDLRGLERLLELNLLEFIKMQLLKEHSLNNWYLSLLFWALRNIGSISQKFRRKMLELELLELILKIINESFKSYKNQNLQTLRNGINLFQILIPSLSIRKCEKLTKLCFKFFKISDFLLLEKTIILCTTISVKFHNVLNLKINKETFKFLKKFQTHNFVKQIKKMLNHSTLSLRLAAYEFCISIFEYIRMHTILKDHVSIAEIFTSLVDKKAIKLLIHGLISNCSFTRKLTVSYFYSIFTLTDYLIKNNKKKKQQNKELKKNQKTIKFHILEISLKLSNWFIDSCLIGPLLSLLILEQDKQLKLRLKIVFFKLLSQSNRNQLRLVWKNIQIDNIFTKKIKQKNNLKLFESFFINHEDRILIFSDIYFQFTSWLLIKLDKNCVKLTTTTFQKVEELISELDNLNVCQAILNVDRNNSRIFCELRLENFLIFKYESKYDRIIWPIPGCSMKHYSILNLKKNLKKFLKHSMTLLASNGRVIVLFRNRIIRDKTGFLTIAKNLGWIIINTKLKNESLIKSFKPLDLQANSVDFKYGCICILQMS